jgi:hypothetical protein
LNRVVSTQLVGDVHAPHKLLILDMHKYAWNFLPILGTFLMAHHGNTWFPCIERRG